MPVICCEAAPAADKLRSVLSACRSMSGVNATVRAPTAASAVLLTSWRLTEPRDRQRSVGAAARLGTG
jgi:hypothetical protein